MRYAHVKKLALAVVQDVEHFCHYILLCSVTAIYNCKPKTYILTLQLLGAKYLKWIVILQEFYLEFTTAKLKKSLVFSDLICSFPSDPAPSSSEERIPDDTLFRLNTLDPWYNDITIYL